MGLTGRGDGGDSGDRVEGGNGVIGLTGATKEGKEGNETIAGRTTTQQWNAVMSKRRLYKPDN